MAIRIPIEKDTQSEATSLHSTFNITIIITTNHTNIEKKTFQKHIQYKLLKDEMHEFHVNMA